MRRREAWIVRRARRSPERPAVECEGERLDYRGLYERARRVAAGLRERGVGRGDRVAALLDGGVEYAELLHGIDLCGAALVPLNTRLAPEEVAFQLRDSGAGLLVHGPGDRAEQARAARSYGVAEPTALDFAELRAASPGPWEPVCVPATEPLAVLYTSGTTGQPKGAVLTRANFFWSALGSVLHLGARPGERWLACLPLFHVAGLSILLRSVLFGGAAVVQRRFDAAAVDRALEEEHIALVSLVPTALARLLDTRGARRAPPGLRVLLLGGAAASPELLARARAWNFPVAPTYGLTEAASQVATGSPADRREEPALRPLAPMRVRILRGDGTLATPGEPGEIAVRGPAVMREYLNHPRATAAALRDGWLHTGDVGQLDERGGLRVLDRRADLIVSGGENVYPAEVEAVLLRHPSVREAAVTGVADASLGRRPAAWVVPARGAQPGAEDLSAYCREHLARYKVPVAFRFVAELPRTSSGKLLRRRLSAPE